MGNFTILALGAISLLPYPGRTLVGELKTKDQSCRAVVWEGMAPALWLLSEEDKKALEAIRNDLERASAPEERKLAERQVLRRFLQLLKDETKKFPFNRRAVTQRHLAVTCGGQLVRAGLAFFPHMMGALLVALHPETGEYLAVADFLPPSGSLELEEVFAKAETLAPQEVFEPKGEPPKVPTPSREWEELGKAFGKAWEQGRVRFWNINGRILPGCPEKCEPGQLQEAWAALSPQSQQAFRPLLGALSRPDTKSEEEQEASSGADPRKRRLVPRLLVTWPSHLGENPFLEAQWELEATGPLPTFDRPAGPLAREIFGTERPKVPEFPDVDAARVFSVIYKSIR